MTAPDEYLGTEVPVTLRTGLPPTPMQRSLLASQARHPTSPLQNMALVSHLDGEVDADRLSAAFESVVRASDVLRSRFVHLDGTATVDIDDHVSPSAIFDVPRADVDGWASERVAVPIDSTQRCYDSAILRHEDGTVSWYLALHHAVTDATSSMLVYERTAAAYDGQPVEIDGYYAWWRRREPRPSARRAASYWRDRRPGSRVGRLYRPVTRPTPTSSRIGIDLDDALRFAVERRLDGDLRAVSHDLGWTVLLTTVTACYLHRLTGATDIAIGLPVHNRSDPSARDLVGPLMEVFPVDVTIRPGDTFRQLHGRVARAVMSTLRRAQPGTAPSVSDCEAIVNVISRAGLGSFGDVPARTRWVHAGATDPNQLVRVQLTSYGEDRQLLIDLNEAAADREHVERAPGHVRSVLADLVGDPDRSVAGRTICLPDELVALQRWGAGPDPGPEPPSVVASLRAVLSGRDEVVVESGDEELTGRELWERACSLAVRLRDQGIGAPGSTTRVGIEMPRSVDAVVAIVATLIAGGSYVPLDPAQPARRLEQLARRADCRLVLRDLPECDPDPDPGTHPAPDREAYLLFTSGSSGEPKAVPISHLGLARYLQFALDNYVADGVPPVVPLFSALTFDLTVTSLFVPLLAGGRMVVVTDDGPAGIAAVARHPDLTWCKATPSHLELLLRFDPRCDLQTIVVGGEAFPGRLARRLFRTFPGARVFNEYGPTEAVVGCMIHEAHPAPLGEAADVPIGRPAPGVRLRVVDAVLEDVPIGAPGELLISHDGLTSGYVDAIDDGSFLESDGARWYRSGDLVRLDGADTLTYLGRIDEQIKIGGIRIEPTEIEHALTAHPAIRRAAVRLWTPTQTAPVHHCVRCGLPDNVPGCSFDDAGVCDTCHAYDRIRDQAADYFRTPADLVALRDRARRDRAGRHDCLHLLSGGKDSTYALYRLVEMGFEVRALTLDNGYISDGAKQNIRRSVTDLGIEHEFVTTEAMDEIFRDSLERHSNVCHGCYKTLYTLATSRAVELGIPMIVTGLSRGQLFETRLVPQQFSTDRFDPDAIDRAVVEARRAYHRLDDASRRLLDTSVFDDDAIFDRVSYVDFFRYVDVELAEMLEFLARSAPWVRPSDTGRSTNCLINAAGIHTHLTEQGYHNYAVPYAWDVRLGHKSRHEAIDELDDDLDLAAVDAMLARVGHRPTPRRILTAWFELDADAVEPRPAELRSFLSEELPAHAVPSAFVVTDRLAMTGNGKLDVGMLPAPTRVHRPGPALHVAAESPLEATIVSVYELVLGLEPVGVTDDFFELGGDSLAALGLVVLLSEELGRTVREELVFTHRTPRDLAAAIEDVEDVGDVGDGDSAPTARPVGEPPPASDAELAMVFEHLDDPENPRYNVGHLFRVHGRLDTERFVAALRSVVDAHAPLHWTHDSPRRRLTADDSMDVFVRTSAVAIADLPGVLRRYHLGPFDLLHGPLGRCVVQPLDDGTVAVLLVVHHVAIDAGSADRLWADIDLAYQGAGGASPPFDYGDHAAWQRGRLRDEQITPWLHEVPGGRVEFAGESGAGGGYVRRTASFSTEELRSGPATTPFASAVAALAVVLRPRVDTDRVGLGLTMSTREHAGADGLVGLFLNTIPAAVAVPAGATYADVAAESSRVVAEALAARHVPLSRIVAARRAAGLPMLPLNVLVALENWKPCRLGTFEVDHEVLATGSPVADVTVFVQIHGSRVELGIEHRNAALGPQDAQRLLEDLDRTIRTSIDRPLVRCADPGTEVAGNAVVHGPAATVRDEVLHELIDECYRRAPDHTAIRFGDENVTYGELVTRANQLARALSDRGVGPGRFVGVVAARRPASVVAILGVLKAGAAYVPIDPDYPPQHIRHMLDDAGITTMVAASVGGCWLGHVPGRVEVIDLDELHPELRPVTPPPVHVGPEDLAYAIYTSGSTGLPKGVAVRHRNIVASTAARDQIYEGAPDRFLVLSSFAFDSSLVGLFWTLCTGGTLVLPPADRHDDVLGLLEVIEADRVTHLLALPSMLRVIETEATDQQLRSLDTVIVAGEACPLDVVELHRVRCPRVGLVNEYGPTEGTVWSHACVLDGSVTVAPVPIGRPIPGVAHVVLDDAGRPVARGEAGELFLAGNGIAAGYVGRPDLTSDRFVDLAPDIVGDRAGPWYRTGDLVRSDPEGRLVFLGRADDQVKVRGHRIEPGEVETLLLSLAGVAGAVVGGVEVGGRTHLVAWLVADQATGPVDPATLREELAERLPSHLVPSRFVWMPQIPLGPNGKVDRQALPTVEGPPAEVPGSTGERPDGSTWRELERRLAAIWAEALNVRSVALDDNFFELGGDSIISLQIAARARRAGIDIRPRQLFEHPTVRRLAVSAGTVTTAVDQTPVVGPVPLTPIQRWFFEQGHPQPGWWNQTLTLDLAPDTDVPVLLHALDLVRGHHDQLRAHFDTSCDPPAQSVTAHVPPAVVREIDIADATESDVAAAVEELESSLDLERGRLVGVLVCRYEGVPHRMVVTVHHLVVDSVSWTAIVEDWGTSYRSVAAGVEALLPERSTSVRSWATELRAAAEAGRFSSVRDTWTPASDSADRTLCDSDLNIEQRGRTVAASLDPAPTAELIGLTTAVGDDVFTVEELLLAAAALVVPRAIGHEHLTVVLEGHGREDVLDAPVDLGRAVGWFTTLYPVSLPTPVRGRLPTVLDEVRSRLRSIPDRGVGFGAERYLSGSITGALPVVAVNYLGQVDVAIRPTPPFTRVGELRAGISPRNRRSHLLGILATIRNGRLTVTVDHLPDHVGSEVAAALAEELLDTIVDLARSVDSSPSLDLVDLTASDAERLGALMEQLGE